MSKKEKKQYVPKMRKLKTKRLFLETATVAEMERLCAETTDPELQKAYLEMLDGCNQNLKQYAWYAAWKITDRQTGEMVGDLCFKGPQVDGAVEIGYGLKPGQEGKGYMTEAVKAMCNWALGQENVYFIFAETLADNEKSQQVLENNGFKPTGTNGEEGSRFYLEREKSSWMTIYLCLGMSIGLSMGINQGNQAIGMCLGMSIGMALGAGLDSSDKKARQTFRQKLSLPEEKVEVAEKKKGKKE